MKDRENCLIPIVWLLQCSKILSDQAEAIGILP